jgi:tetratricopeptide (TPR) repeat protein
MNSQQVEIYLEAENDVINKNYVEAFRKYESILFDEPGNAATHNSLGWIYKTQMDDYANAENHYKAAINGDPSYPHSYLNYMILLMDLERYNDIQALAKRASKVEAVDKSWIQHRLGLVEELQLQFDKAINFYEKAILFSLNDEKIKGYKEDIARCEEKRELHSKHSPNK